MCLILCGFRLVSKKLKLNVSFDTHCTHFRCHVPVAFVSPFAYSFLSVFCVWIGLGSGVYQGPDKYSACVEFVYAFFDSFCFIPLVA